MLPYLTGHITLIKSNRGSEIDTKNYQFTYEWTIRDFLQFDERITISPSFSSHCADLNDEWILRCYPSPGSYLGTRLLSVELQRLSFNDTLQFQTKCKISTDNRNGKIMKYNSYKFDEKTAWNEDISIPDLLDPLYLNLSHNQLKIRCTIKMSRKLPNNSDVPSPFDEQQQQLSVDLKKLLLSEQSADVTIRVGHKTFRAIKGILAVRSPVFSAMFDHEEFQENKKNEVVIEDIEEDVFEEFLHYVYTNESPKIDIMPMDLLDVAEKYQVDCLKNLCEATLFGMINCDNLANSLVWSDKYNLKKLNQKCLKFMKKNLKTVMMNETFKSYQEKYPEIFVIVFHKLLLSAS